MLKNQLLEEEEGPLVDYTLSNLHLTGPSVGRPRLLAVVALGILHNKLNSERLLQHSVVLDLLLHCELKLDSATVRLRPNELRVEQLDLFESFHVLEANG